MLCAQWTQFELWLSLQTTTERGLVPVALRRTHNQQPREHLWPIHSATDELADALNRMWREKTPEQAHRTLSSPDVRVTNQSDKEGQLKKILKLNKEVRQALGGADDEDEGLGNVDVWHEDDDMAC